MAVEIQNTNNTVGNNVDTKEQQRFKLSEKQLEELSKYSAMFYSSYERFQIQLKDSISQFQLQIGEYWNLALKSLILLYKTVEHYALLYPPVLLYLVIFGLFSVLPLTVYFVFIVSTLFSTLFMYLIVLGSVWSAGSLVLLGFLGGNALLSAFLVSVATLGFYFYQSLRHGFVHLKDFVDKKQD